MRYAVNPAADIRRCRGRWPVRGRGRPCRQAGRRRSRWDYRTLVGTSCSLAAGSSSVHDYLGKRQPSDSGKEPPIPAVVARREMVERAAADNGAEECLEPPRRTDEKQAVSDITPSPGSRRPSADATQHIETDTAPDDDEPHPVGFGARARSERAEQDDGEDSSAPGRAKPLEMRLDQFGRLSVSGGAPGSPSSACHPVAAIRRCRSR